MSSLGPSRFQPIVCGLLLAGVACAADDAFVPIDPGSGDSLALTIPPDSLQAPTLSLGLASLTLDIGSSQQVRATVTNHLGVPIPVSGLEWFSNNRAVATVSGSGLVTGVGEGATSIGAVEPSAGVSSSLSVVVNPDDAGPAPPPDPPPAGVYLEETWSYGSTAEVAASPHISNTFNSTLETGPPSQYAPSGRFMRSRYEAFNYPSVSDYSATVGVDIPDASTVRPRHMWVEVAVRFAPNWRVAPSVSGFTTDDKTILVNDQNFSSRWEVHFGIFGGLQGSLYGGPDTDFGPPYMRAFPPSLSNGWLDVWDGEWHWLRMEYRMSSGTNTADGEWRVGLDNQWLMENTRLNARSGSGLYFAGMLLGANADLESATHRDWGRLRIYLTDPGWNMTPNPNQN